MGWIKGSQAHRWRWPLVAAGLLSMGCVGVAGAGAAAVLVGAGVLGFACYDRVSVTVTDRLTGAKLCDAKVAFIKGSSETLATSCGQVALSAGKYTLRVEQQGLATFEEPIEVTEDGACGQTVQTVYVALDRQNRVTPPTTIAPPAVRPPAAAPPAAVTAPPAAAPPAAVTAPPAAAPPATAPPAAVTAPSAAAPVPATSSAPPAAAPSAGATPPPAATAFPDAPR